MLSYMQGSILDRITINWLISHLKQEINKNSNRDNRFPILFYAENRISQEIQINTDHFDVCWIDTQTVNHLAKLSNVFELRTKEIELIDSTEICSSSKVDQSWKNMIFLFTEDDNVNSRLFANRIIRIQLLSLAKTHCSNAFSYVR